MIWTISDLHFDGGQNKPMDVFGEEWKDHQARIVHHWKAQVKEEDAVLIPGDISWAMSLEEAVPDLQLLQELPGEKYLLRGNHDYWWYSLQKLNDLGFDRLHFVQNNSFLHGETWIGGTRGWLTPGNHDFTAQDEKIFKREHQRLINSLTTMGEKNNISKVIIMMHYPPFSNKDEPTIYVDEMVKYGVDLCIYGHLHGDGHQLITEGKINGVEFICASADYLKFQLKCIGE